MHLIRIKASLAADKSVPWQVFNQTLFDCVQSLGRFPCHFMLSSILWESNGTLSVLHTQLLNHLRKAKKGAEAGTKTKPQMYSSQGTRLMWLLFSRLLCALELRAGVHVNL